MRLSSGYENKRARVEMLPLIDIVFLLLVFFIYAMLSMTVHRGINVQLPQAVTSTVDKEQQISVTITEDNAIYLDKRLVSLEGLLSELDGESREHPVLISGDRRAQVGVAISVLDGLREVGFSEVSFQCTKPVE